MKNVRKILSLLIVSSLIMTYTAFTASAAEPQSNLKGDINADGKVTASDALTILRAAVGERTLTSEEFLIADVTGDGKVTASDALMVLRYAVGAGDDMLQATELKNLSAEAVIEKVGPLFTQDQKSSGVLASVSLAQFILESGYGKSELAQNANNCFGMKKNLSGNTWKGSVWDGVSVYTIHTQEQNPDGSYETIVADFRKYTCIEDSIADHSAYLTGAMNGDKLRYDGIVGNKDYRAVAQLIKDGGYATSLTYVDKLCELIERWNLTRFDC